MPSKASRPAAQPAVVSLGDVASSILDAELPGDGVPILARRRGPEKRIAEEKAEEREQLEVARAKRALKGQVHRQLKATGASNPALEMMLRKTATKGVVALFNAVRNAQREAPEPSKPKRRRLGEERSDPADGAGSSTDSGVANRAFDSRDSFLDILRRGSSGAQRLQKKPQAPALDATGADFLQEDFMMGRNRAKDWEHDIAGDVDSGEARGVDFDEDDL